MKTPARGVLILAALILIAAVPVSAPALEGSLAFVGVFPDEAMSICEFTEPWSGITVSYVVLTNSIPLKQISFSAPIPACRGIFYVETSPYTVTGNSQTGITIDFGGCITAPATVLTIYSSGNTPDGCCSWEVRSNDGGSSQIEFVDCNDVERPGESAVYGPLPEWGCCRIRDVLAPYEPYPSDGATGVSTEVDLAWLLPDPRCGEFLYFGKTPFRYTNVPWDNYDYFTAFDPGTLEPNTTYYWQVYMQCGYYDNGSVSAMWSFTTGDGPVVTEQTTWGKVKALYAR